MEEDNRFYLLTHHKCASNWALAYLREVGVINGLHVVATHQSNRIPREMQAQIVVLINADYDFIRDKIPAGIHMVRNPNAILASAYHSHLKTHDAEQWPELAAQRRLLESVTAEEGYLLTLPFLERQDFGDGVIGPFLALRRWDFDDARYRTLRMEDCTADAAGTIGSALRAHFGTDLVLPDIETFRFERFSGNRPAGTIDETSHYRSGSADRWQSELPAAAKAYVAVHQTNVIQRFYTETSALA